MPYSWPERFWDHQRRGCQAVVDSIGRGTRRIVLTAPTGMGKSRMMVALIEWATAEWQRSVMYCHRRLLFDQTCGVLDAHGVEYGQRAAGHKPALLRDVQICMTPSEVSAVYRKKRRALHPANLVLSDELHAQGGDMLPAIHQEHYEQGAVVCGVTATPLDLVAEWDELIVAGTTSEGRRCGALVPAYTYCPDEPDMKHIKNYRVGEDLTDRENSKVMMRPGVFGRVYQHWERLNPKHKPTILFGPDVAGSLYFAQEFHEKGVRAAHIDAKQIWYNGEFLESDDETRHWALKATETGEIEVLCNRFVLREGIDLPQIAVGILACVFGSLKSYLQSVGRVLRASPGLTECILIDHGANFRRHGSPNEDRKWFLGQSGYKTTGLRQDAMRENPELEPITCPRCGMMRLSGPTCPKCGYSCHKRSKMVVQVSGELRLVEGPSYRPHRTAMKKDTQKTWKRYFYGAKRKGRTFNQAAAWMFYNERYYPPRDLPLMPIEPGDWYERIADVPKERLR